MAGLRTAFSALRYRDFRWLWTGTFFSTGGQWIQQATLGWVVYDLTGSGTLLGSVLGIRAIPMLLLAPVTGVIADRFDRRHALAASQVLVVVISVLMAALLAFDAVRTWHLFAFSLLAGVGAVFDRTLRGTLVFNSVPRAEANAVALNSIAFSVMRTLGPGVAGVLIGSVGAAWNFGIQAILYAGVAACALIANASPPVRAGVKRVTAWHDMAEGLRFIGTDPIAHDADPRTGAADSADSFARRAHACLRSGYFPHGPEGLGLLLSAVGAGGVLGAVIAAWVARFDRVGLLQTLSLVVFALSLIGFALSRTLAGRDCIPDARRRGGNAARDEQRDDAADVRAGAHARARREPAADISRVHLRRRFHCGSERGSPGGADGRDPSRTRSLLVTAGAWLRSAPLRRVRLSGLIAGGQTH